MASVQYTGNDLLQVFNDLNINIGSLNPNVVKAWFDTDCPKMKNLLSWLCSALTENNYLTALEKFEYTTIKNVLQGEELVKEKQSIEIDFPEIFQYETNVFEVELLEEELELIKKEHNDYENLIKMNKKIGQNLSKEISRLELDVNKTTTKLKREEEHCLKLSIELDRMNSKLYNQILKISQYELDSKFLNNFDIISLEKSMDSTFKHICKFIHSRNISENYGNNSFFESLLEMHNRISESEMCYLVKRMENNELSYTLNFLDNYNVSRNSLFIDCDSIQTRIGFKKEQEIILMDIIRSSAKKIVENYINQPKLSQAKNELKLKQSKLEYIEKIEQIVIKILLHCIEMSTLFGQEKADVVKLFKNLVNYINKDLQDCVLRNHAMVKFVEKYEAEYNNNSNNIEKLEIMSDFRKILGSKNESLTDILANSDQVNSEVKDLEQELFGTDNNRWKKDSSIMELMKDIEVLSKFLLSGPTNKVVVIPPDLQLAFNEISDNLKQQETALKSAVYVTKEISKYVGDKKSQNRRQFWMHFLNNPQKMLVNIAQAEEEFNQQHLSYIKRS